MSAQANEIVYVDRFRQTERIEVKLIPLKEEGRVLKTGFHMFGQHRKISWARQKSSDRKKRQKVDYKKKW